MCRARDLYPTTTQPSDAERRFLFALWRWGQADTTQNPNPPVVTYVLLFALWRWGQADYHPLCSNPFRRVSAPALRESAHEPSCLMIVMRYQQLLVGAQSLDDKCQEPVEGGHGLLHLFVADL
jgi:hypothetical protein